jgi:hypothetical protein
VADDRVGVVAAGRLDRFKVMRHLGVEAWVWVGGMPFGFAP